MTKEMKSYLSTIAWFQSDYQTWVTPWRVYWRLVFEGGKRDLTAISKELSVYFPGYVFNPREETVINNVIYSTIVICAKE